MEQCGIALDSHNRGPRHTATDLRRLGMAMLRAALVAKSPGHRNGQFRLGLVEHRSGVFQEGPTQDVWGRTVTFVRPADAQSLVLAIWAGLP
jgi:hypothetical protein